MDYEKLRTTRNEKNSFANYLGISVRKVREGYAEAVVVCNSLHQYCSLYSKKY